VQQVRHGATGTANPTPIIQARSTWSTPYAAPANQPIPFQTVSAQNANTSLSTDGTTLSVSGAKFYEVTGSWTRAGVLTGNNTLMKVYRNGTLLGSLFANDGNTNFGNITSFLIPSNGGTDTFQLMQTNDGNYPANLAAVQLQVVGIN
jgi:hypothetical protein